jgi:signal transduction histidine kinase
MYSPLIRTDENRIKQVLLGLVSNAIKFTRVGGVTVRVSII